MSLAKLFLDTNALLNLQSKAFQEEFVVSQKTLEEIEHIKVSGNKDAEIKYRARYVAHLLDEHYGEYKVAIVDSFTEEEYKSRSLVESPDNIILATAEQYIARTGEEVIFVTDDINVKVVAKNIFKFNTKGTKELNLTKEIEKYKGYTEIALTDDEVNSFIINKEHNIAFMNNLDGDFLINQYVTITDSEGNAFDKFRYTENGFERVKDTSLKSSYFDRIKPKDVYQACAIDSILNNNLTAISGKAGSGKSLLSLASIMKLVDSGKYEKVIIMHNPTKARGASDMGYYSGNAIEKAMQNNIGSILTTKFGDPYLVETLLAQGKISLVSMADIRGMEIRDGEIAYITEAQNTSIDLIKLCISRVAEGAKVVIEGDYNSQVDSFAFENTNNGMKRVIDVFKGEPEFGYVELKNVWRSRLAELSDRL